MANLEELRKEIDYLKDRLHTRVEDLKKYETEMKYKRDNGSNSVELTYLDDLVNKTKYEIDYLSSQIAMLEKEYDMKYREINNNSSIVGGTFMGNTEIEKVIGFHWEAESSVNMVPRYLPVINILGDTNEAECYTFIEATSFEACAKKGYSKYIVDDSLIKEFFLEVEKTNWNDNFVDPAFSDRGKWKVEIKYDSGLVQKVEGFNGCVPKNAEEICGKLDKIIKSNPDCRFSGRIF